MTTQYEVRYEDKKGRYTEETWESKHQALARATVLDAGGLEVEVWEVQRGPERRIDK